MSFQIHLRGRGLNLLARVKDESLNEILRIIQEQRADEGEPPGWGGPAGEGRPGPRWPRPPHRPPPPLAEMAPEERREARQALRQRPLRPAAPSPEESAARKKLAALQAAPLREHAALTFAEKLLLLGAWTEARKEKFLIRGPLLAQAFVLAGDSPPANPQRDVMAAVQAGWIALGQFPNPKRATLTPEGWARVLDLLG